MKLRLRHARCTRQGATRQHRPVARTGKRMSARRTSLTSTSSRRRSTGAPRLGAVKLGQSPLGASASEAGEARAAAVAAARRLPWLERSGRCRHAPCPVFPRATLAGPLVAGSPISSSEPASALATPQQQSPLAPSAGQASSAGTAHASSADSGHVAATAVAADVVAQFSQQLASSRSADRWLEERLAEPSNGGKGEWWWTVQWRRGAPGSAQLAPASLRRLHVINTLPTTSTHVTCSLCIKVLFAMAPVTVHLPN